MLRRNDRLDDGGDIEDIGKGFNAEEDIVVRSLRVPLCFLGGFDNCNGNELHESMFKYDRSAYLLEA